LAEVTSRDLQHNQQLTGPADAGNIISIL